MLFTNNKIRIFVQNCLISSYSFVCLAHPSNLLKHELNTPFVSQLHIKIEFLIESSMPRKIIYSMHILFIFTIAQSSSHEYKIQDSIYRDVSPPIPGRRKIGGEKFSTRAILKETFPLNRVNDSRRGRVSRKLSPTSLFPPPGDEKS